jgi:hypothetical protein
MPNRGVGNFPPAVCIGKHGTQWLMSFRHSHQLLEILRTTLAKIEKDPSVESSDEEMAKLRRVLVRWIAEAEAVDSPSSIATSAPAETVSTSAVPVPPAKKAIELAVALITSPPAPKAADDHDGPPINDPASA